MDKGTTKRKLGSSKSEPNKKCTTNKKTLSFQHLCRENTKKQIDVLTLENRKTYETKSIASIKTNKVLLDEDNENKICIKIENYNHSKKATTYYSISQYFKVSKLVKTSFALIERCFPIIADSTNFLELDIMSLKKILASSELFIDSELQVFSAVKRWLSYKPSGRSKYAKDLIIKIRLPLLSVFALNHILNDTSCSIMDESCLDIIKDVIKNKKDYRLRTTCRHYIKENFSFIIVGCEEIDTDPLATYAYKIDANNLSRVNSLSEMNYKRKWMTVVCNKGEVYVFGGTDSHDNDVMAIEKYSPATNTWSVIGQMFDDRFDFCASSFINSIYLIGGFLGDETNTCLEFKAIDKSWQTVSKMNQIRRHASCTVFEGRVVVSGGYNRNDRKLNTVKAYDHIDDLWLNMPNMVKERRGHKSVAIKNKLFIVGGFGESFIEVFDSFCNKFSLLKINSDVTGDVTSTGNKIVIFSYSDTDELVYFYDVENDMWSRKVCKVIKNIGYFSCDKLPQM